MERPQNTAYKGHIIIAIFRFGVFVTHVWALPGGDDAALVEPAGQVDHNLARTVVIHHLKLPDVAMLHHHSQEPHHNLGAGAEEDLQQKGENEDTNQRDTKFTIL